MTLVTPPSTSWCLGHWPVSSPRKTTLWTLLSIPQTQVLGRPQNVYRALSNRNEHVRVRLLSYLSERGSRPRGAVLKDGMRDRRRGGAAGRMQRSYNKYTNTVVSKVTTGKEKSTKHSLGRGGECGPWGPVQSENSGQSWHKCSCSQWEPREANGALGKTEQKRQGSLSTLPCVALSQGHQEIQKSRFQGSGEVCGSSQKQFLINRPLHAQPAQTDGPFPVPSHLSSQPTTSSPSKETTRPGPEGTQTELSLLPQRMRRWRKEASRGSECYPANSQPRISATPTHEGSCTVPQGRAVTVPQSPLPREPEVKGFCTPGHLSKPGTHSFNRAFFTALKAKDGGGRRGDTEPGHSWERNLMHQEPGQGMANSFHVGYLLPKASGQSESSPLHTFLSVLRQ